MGTLHTMRKAAPGDLQQLVALMTEFYAASPYTLNPRRAAEAFTRLLAEDRLGQVWFIQAGSNDVGYVVVTLSYSMEYGGPSAIVDDLFIQPAFRGAGLGKAALAENSLSATPWSASVHPRPPDEGMAHTLRLD
jgi:GNAT superfamily N-acetyltransferase